MKQKLIDNIENKGQTTLFRVIRNLKKSNKNENGEHFSRFTFLVTLQYLNEKEKFLKEVFIQDNKIVNIKLKSLKIVPGKSKDVDLGDIDKDYEIAKKSIIESIKGKREYSNAISLLNKRLGKEVERVYKHYIDQSSEKDFELENARKKLRQLRSKLNHARDPKELRNLRKNVKFKEEQIKALVDNEYSTRLKKERQFFVEDEKNKYGLNVNMELFNVSVFYYDS